MESDNFSRTSLLEKDVNLARRYNKLTLIFKFFFISLSLIIAALFIFLLQDIASDSDQPIPGLNPANQPFEPIIRTESQMSLQRAAKQLEDVTSSILYNYLGSNIDATTELALKTCWRSLQNGSAQIRDALEVNPVPDNDEQRVDDVIMKAEENIQSCLDDLEKVESTAAIEVRAMVLGAKVCLSGRGDFVMNYDCVLQKFLSAIAAAWTMVLDNLFVVCLCGLQLLFIVYLLWTLFKFR